MKKISFGLLMLTLLAFSFFSCSDKVDESNIYVFNGKSIADYIKEDPDLSYYYFMLQHAKSGKKGSRTTFSKHAETTPFLCLPTTRCSIISTQFSLLPTTT